MEEFSQDPLPIGAAARDAIEQRVWDADGVLVYPQGRATPIKLTAYRQALLHAAAQAAADAVVAEVAQTPPQPDVPRIPTDTQRRAALGLVGEAPND